VRWVISREGISERDTVEKRQAAGTRRGPAAWRCV